MSVLFDSAGLLFLGLYGLTIAFFPARNIGIPSQMEHCSFQNCAIHDHQQHGSSKVFIILPVKKAGNRYFCLGLEKELTTSEIKCIRVTFVTS